MTETLYCGDPHVRPEDLADSQALLDLIYEQAHRPHGLVDRIVFLGDLHHTHSILHVEVLAFWRKNLAKLGSLGRPVYLLVGNHDMPGDIGSSSHALMAYKGMKNIYVIDKPACHDGILWMPYMADAQEFVKVCQASELVRLSICHQTFQGAAYENGFYAKDGIDYQQLPQQEFYSGHIHSQQAFGKVIYPGSPRWLTVSDAKVGKYIFIFDHDDMTFTPKEPCICIPTDTRCSRIFLLEETPDALLEFDPVARHRYTVDLRGPQRWIDERRKFYAGKARIRTFRTDEAVAKVRESDGIHEALFKYMSAYKPNNNTSIPVLEQMVKERLYAQ